MKINFAQKVLLLFVLIFILVLAGNIVVGNFVYKKISDINNKIKQVTLSAEERERAAVLKDSLLNSEIDRDKLEEYFVGSTDADTANFITYIEGLARQNGLVYDVRNVAYEPVSELSNSEHINFIKFRVNVVGSWNNVFTFLQVIENLPKVVSLGSVSFDNGPSLSSKTRAKIWSADLEFSVARFKN